MPNDNKQDEVVVADLSGEFASKACQFRNKVSFNTSHKAKLLAAISGPQNEFFKVIEQAAAPEPVFIIPEDVSSAHKPRYVTIYSNSKALNNKIREVLFTLSGLANDRKEPFTAKEISGRAKHILATQEKKEGSKVKDTSQPVELLDMRVETENDRAFVKATTDTMLNRRMMAVNGPTGTGKTFVPLKIAVQMLKGELLPADGHAYKKIVCIRPLVPSGKKNKRDVGTVPGGLDKKTAHYMRPVHDNLKKILTSQEFNSFIQTGKIETVLIDFARGMTIDDAVIILDEAQNTAAEDIYLIATRLGPKSCLIVNGDVTNRGGINSQCDLPDGQQSGLTWFMKVCKKAAVFPVVTLEKKDIKRSEIVRVFCDAADAVEEEERAHNSSPPQPLRHIAAAQPVIAALTPSRANDLPIQSLQ